MQLLTMALPAFLVLTGCSREVPEDSLIGTWMSTDEGNQSECSFFEDGAYEYTFQLLDSPRARQYGRYRVSGERNHRKLRTCTDGMACTTGGTWTTQVIDLHSGDLLTLATPPPLKIKTHWRRVSTHP